MSKIIYRGKKTATENKQDDTPLAEPNPEVEVKNVEVEVKTTAKQPNKNSSLKATATQGKNTSAEANEESVKPEPTKTAKAAKAETSKTQTDGVKKSSARISHETKDATTLSAAYGEAAPAVAAAPATATESIASPSSDGTLSEKRSRTAKKAESTATAEVVTMPSDSVKPTDEKPEDAQKSTSYGIDSGASAAPEETFDKQAIIKYFKRHPKLKINSKVERFEPDLKKGLSPEQVETRFKQYLFNDTNKKYSKSYASIFIGNICTFFNLLCLLAFIALIISGVQGITNYLVIFVTAANVFIGIIQEIRSKLAVDKLSIMATSMTKVLRDGEVVEIPTSEIVLDDVIIMELGSQVPADCILADGNVEVNESLLTGESVSVKKKIGETLYAGSFISGGNGKCRVDKVGKDTFLEKLTAKAKKYQRPKSELMNSITAIIKTISIIIFPIAIGVFFVTRSHGAADAVNVSAWLLNYTDSQALARTCSVVIGMIPSGMLLLTSVALAVGVVRLSKNNTLVRDLYSLEMLARVNVLCLDKTGTITDGRMTVSDAVILNTVGELSLNEIMGNMLFALDDNNQTSIALKNHFGHSDTMSATQKIPFTSKRKLSAVSFDGVGTFVMGAPEFVLQPMPPKVERIVKQYAQMGLRVITVAHSSSMISGDRLPSILKPIAVISIADNIREDAIETIKWFKGNDVQVKVISGDNPITVSEVAKRAGIENADKFISLEGLNEKEVENVANKYTVFGRVTPEQKAILVRSIKSEGNTVAMTGDGVNDILALKEADCAISVASGSEAARNVSHLVLMDNNFGNMPKVVGEGRRVINNIKNSASLYLMKTLFTTLLAVITILFQNYFAGYPFLPSHMLLLEIFVIGVPSFFLSLQPNNDRVQGKFISHVMTRSIPGALIMVLCVLAMYIVCQIAGADFSEYRTAMCMLALTFSGLIMLFRVCQPFNAFRLILFGLMLAMCIVAISLPPIGTGANAIDIPESLCSNWRDLEWTGDGNFEKVLIVIVALEAAFPLSQWLINLMQILLPSATDGQKKTAKEEQQNKKKAK